jgi:uncharacterized membrane protein
MSTASAAAANDTKKADSVRRGAKETTGLMVTVLVVTVVVVVVVVTVLVLVVDIVVVVVVVVVHTSTKPSTYVPTGISMS